MNSILNIGTERIKLLFELFPSPSKKTIEACSVLIEMLLRAVEIKSNDKKVQIYFGVYLKGENFVGEK